MRLGKKARTITTVQQGQIIQRVLVDGWSTAAAAAAFDLEERLVAAWIADYRRHGMASLQRAPSRSLAAEIFRLKLARPVSAALRRMAGGLRRAFVREPPAQLSPLRRSHDDRRGAS
jgi:transposase-like protein